MLIEMTGYRRVIQIAGWIWVIYQASLSLVDTGAFPGPMNMDLHAYILSNLIPAVLFLAIAYTGFLAKHERTAIPMMIGLITIVPIILNYMLDLHLPPAPLTNLEGIVLRQLPLLLIGLILVAWRYSMAVMVFFGVSINFFELLLVLLSGRFADPRYAANLQVIIIRTACFLVVGGFTNLLISQLRVMAVRDALTGLYNRRFLNEFLNRDINRAARDNSGLSIVLLDIDHFKFFNDNNGHLAGDEMLREVARQLGMFIRKGDIACRYGGEEFIWVMPGATAEEACKRMEQLRRTIEGKYIKYKGANLQVTCSAGVAGYPMDGTDMESLIKAADEALYMAKSAGRNRVLVQTRLVPE